MKQFESEISANKSIAEDYFELRFRWDASTRIPEPGQFLTIKANWATAPLLRRPFALSSFDSGLKEASIIYQVRGPATKLLKEKRSGEQISVAGPFGNSFDKGSGSALHVIVAGGIGLGPMLYWASRLKSSGEKLLFVFGCRNKALVPDIDAFRTLDPVVCTDDGSFGFKGTTLDYLRTLTDWSGARIYSCGPHPMLKACHNLAFEKGIPCFVSMEEYMACGVGACMGCVIKDRSEKGYARVCKEGPIFNSEDLIWE